MLEKMRAGGYVLRRIGLVGLCIWIMGACNTSSTAPNGSNAISGGSVKVADLCTALATLNSNPGVSYTAGKLPDTCAMTNSPLNFFSQQQVDQCLNSGGKIVYVSPLAATLPNTPFADVCTRPYTADPNGAEPLVPWCLCANGGCFNGEKCNFPSLPPPILKPFSGACEIDSGYCRLGSPTNCPSAYCGASLSTTSGACDWIPPSTVGGHIALSNFCYPNKARGCQLKSPLCAWDDQFQQCEPSADFDCEALQVIHTQSGDVCQGPPAAPGLGYYTVDDYCAVIGGKCVWAGGAGINVAVKNCLNAITQQECTARQACHWVPKS